MIIINDKTKSYDEFIKDCILFGKIISKYTNERDVILISKRTSFEQIQFFIGAILYNRIPIIISYPTNKVYKNELLDKMNKIDKVVFPKLCICDDIDYDFYKQIWENTICQYEFYDTNIEPIKNININEIAFIQLSSGTTGIPKITKITHKALLAQCDEYAYFINLNNNDVIVSWLPLYHDMGLIACFLLPLLKKISFVHIDTFKWLSNPQLLFDAIEQYKGTLVWLPNFTFSYLTNRCQNSTSKLNTVRQWISCSEMTSESNLKKFIHTFSKNGIVGNNIKICYALAENVFAVSQTKALKTKDNIMSCGELLFGTSVIIKDTNNDIITSSGKSGNIYIRSSYLADKLELDEFGYYNTNDIGFIFENELYVTGRSDDMIISYGKNIFPYDIEKDIGLIENTIPGRIACFGVFDKDIETQNIYIVIESDMIDDKKNLQNKIKDFMLIKYEINCKIFIKEKGYIIKTSSGKINRKHTRDKLLNE